MLHNALREVCVPVENGGPQGSLDVMRPDYAIRFRTPPQHQSLCRNRHMKDGISKATQILKERSLEELVNTCVGEVPLAPSLNDRIQEPEVHHHQIARLRKGILMQRSHIRWKPLVEPFSSIRICGKHFSNGPPGVANGFGP